MTKKNECQLCGMPADIIVQDTKELPGIISVTTKTGIWCDKCLDRRLMEIAKDPTLKCIHGVQLQEKCPKCEKMFLMDEIKLKNKFKQLRKPNNFNWKRFNEYMDFALAQYIIDTKTSIELEKRINELKRELENFLKYINKKL